MKDIVARSPKWNTVECLICWLKSVHKLMQTAFQFSGMFNASQVETLSSALTSPELSPCKKCPINQVILMQLPLANRRLPAWPASNLLRSDLCSWLGVLYRSGPYSWPFPFPARHFTPSAHALLNGFNTALPPFMCRSVPKGYRWNTEYLEGLFPGI